MRLFVGIEIPEDIANDLYPLARAVRGLDAQTPQNMHVTLKFIGNVDRGSAQEIDKVLSGLSFSPFDLAISGLGMFASSRKVRIFWAGLTESRELNDLAGRVARGLARIEDLPEADTHKFTPHVTLGRNRDASRARIEQVIADHFDTRSRVFTVDRFCLYESHTSNDGPIFDVVAAYTGA